MGGMQRSTGVRRRHPPAQRDKLLAVYQRSGLTQKEFARQAGIGHSTLARWLRRQTTTAKTAASAGFVPVPNLFTAVAGSAAPAYRLQFPRGVIVEVTAGFQSGELTALLQMVQTL